MKIREVDLLAAGPMEGRQNEGCADKAPEKVTARARRGAQWNLLSYARNGRICYQTEGKNVGTGMIEEAP